jgi:hypothetical protein
MPGEDVLKQEELGEEEQDFVDGLGLDNDSKETKEDKPDKEEKKEEKIIEEEEDEEEGGKKKEDDEEEETKEEEAEETEDKEDEEEEDLSEEEVKKLPKDAKGLYYAKKKETKRRQDIEAELNHLKLKLKYDKPPVKEKEEEPDSDKDINAIDTEIETLLSKGDDEVLTVGEQRKLLNLQAQKKELETKKATTKDKKKQKEIDTKRAKFEEIENNFKTTHKDYVEKLNIFAKAVQEFPGLRFEILAEYDKEDGNPHAKVYEIGTKFADRYGGEKKKTADSKQKDDVNRILRNAGKRKPSASAASSNVSEESLAEMEKEELGKHLASLPLNKYLKVPRKIRQKAMRL